MTRINADGNAHWTHPRYPRNPRFFRLDFFYAFCMPQGARVGTDMAKAAISFIVVFVLGLILGLLSARSVLRKQRSVSSA
jgi:hypothetical protein